MSEHPGKPRLSLAQLELAILDAEIKESNARTALMTYRKERLDQAETLRRIAANEAVQKTKIAEAAATLVDLRKQESEAQKEAEALATAQKE